MPQARFPNWWSQPYGETPPFGYLLRRAFAPRWFRIHSLPESKRYPETETEFDMLLERQDAVAHAVLDGPARLITATYEAEVVGTTRVLGGRGPHRFECFASFWQPDDGMLAEGEFSFWSTDTLWDLAADAKLLRRMAMDETRAVWMNRSTGEVFAPYDGGLDIIAADEDRRNSLRATFSAWLPDNDAGL